MTSSGLFKVVVGGGVVTVLMGSALHLHKQRELKGSKWFKNALLKVHEHEGVQVLIGPHPIKIGDVTRHYVGTSDLVPKVPIVPEPLFVIEVPLYGKIGTGKILMWLNLLCPPEEAVDNIDAWNVALIELEVGKKNRKKFVVK